MDPSYSAEMEQGDFQQSQDFTCPAQIVAPQFIQEQQIAGPSTYYQTYPANDAAFNQMDVNHMYNDTCNVNDGSIENYNNIAINNCNIFQDINQIGDQSVTVDGRRNNHHYHHIMLPNGEIVFMDALNNVAGNANMQNVVKRKRVRTVFSEAQAKALEAEYTLNKYLNQSRRRTIARTLNLTEKTVKVWFQNQRMKEKKVFNESISNNGTPNAFVCQGAYQNICSNPLPQPYNIMVNAGLQQQVVTPPAYQPVRLPTYSEAVYCHPPTNMSSYNRDSTGNNSGMRNFGGGFNTPRTNDVTAMMCTINNSVSLYDSSSSSEDGLIYNQIFEADNVSHLPAGSENSVIET